MRDGLGVFDCVDDDMKPNQSDSKWKTSTNVL